MTSKPTRASIYPHPRFCLGLTEARYLQDLLTDIEAELEPEDRDMNDHICDELARFLSEHQETD